MVLESVRVHGISAMPVGRKSILQSAIRALSLWLILLLGVSLEVNGQGTLLFQNLVPAIDLDAPVFGPDGSRLQGPEWVAQLQAGPSLAARVPVGSPVSFGTGTGAGYVVGGAVTVPTVAPGDAAFVELLVWNTLCGETWEESANTGAAGVSQTIEVNTGGSGVPPSLPARLDGLTSFTILGGGFCIPEPQTNRLLLLAGLLIFLRLVGRRSRPEP